MKKKRKKKEKLIQQIRWHPNQTWIGVARDSNIEIYDFHLEKIYEFVNDGLACICSFDFEGWDHVLACYYMGDIFKWCISTGQLVSKISTFYKCSTILSYQPDQYFIGTDYGGVFSQSKTELFIMRDRVTCMTFSDREQCRWVVGCYDGIIGICQHSLLIKIIHVDFRVFSVDGFGSDLIVGGRSSTMGITQSMDHEWIIKTKTRSKSWFSPNIVCTTPQRIFMGTDTGCIVEMDPILGINMSCFSKREILPIRSLLISPDHLFFYYSSESRLERHFRFPILQSLFWRVSNISFSLVKKMANYL